MLAPERVEQVGLGAFIGKIPFHEATDLLGPRYGRRVRAQSLNFVRVQSPEFKSVYRHHEDVLREQAFHTKSQRALALLRTQSVILAKLNAAGRKLHATEVAAGLLVENGLESAKITPIFNAARNLERTAPKKGTFFDGEFSDLTFIARSGLYKKVFDILHQTRGQLHTTRNLAALVFPKFSSLSKYKRMRATHFVTRTLAVLELARLASKQPYAGELSQFTWTSYKHRFKAPKPFHCIGYRLLELLSNGPVTLEAASAIARNSNLNDWRNNLLRQNVIKTEKVPGVNKRVTSLELTDYGKKLVDAQAKSSTITPEMRIVLLGEKMLSPDPLELIMRDQAIKAMKVLEMNSAGNSYKEIANVLGIPESYAIGVISRNRSPIRASASVDHVRRRIESVRLVSEKYADMLHAYCLTRGLLSETEAKT